MSRKSQRVSYSLDAGNVKSLSSDEIKAILRGADSLIMKGGRAMLVKVLKGSRQKKVLELGLNRNPVYGYYRRLTLPEIAERVDWMILNGYLALEYDGRLPMLVFTPRGWEIERESYARELLLGFDEMLEGDRRPFDMEYLKDRNRGMILLLLDLVEETEDPKYIPLLKAWAEIDYRKVKQRIGEVVARLAARP